MRKVFLTLIIVLALISSINASAGRGGQVAANFSWSYLPVRQNPVEQLQTPDCPDPYAGDPACDIGNFTAYLGYGDSGISPFAGRALGCAWDVDDNSFAQAVGYMNAGANISMTQCQVYDEANSPQNSSSCFYDIDNSTGCGRPVEVNVYSTSPSLNVILCLEGGPCLVPVPTYDKSQRLYRYYVRARAIYPLNDPRVQEIPLSNGGRGVIGNQTVTIENPTNKKIQTVSATFAQYGWAQGSYYKADQFHDSELTFRWAFAF